MRPLESVRKREVIEYSIKQYEQSLQRKDAHRIVRESYVEALESNFNSYLKLIREEVDQVKKVFKMVTTTMKEEEMKYPKTKAIEDIDKGVNELKSIMERRNAYKFSNRAYKELISELYREMDEIISKKAS